jgi:hypothetical protein
LAATLVRPAVASILAAGLLFWIQRFWIHLDFQWQTVVTGGVIYLVLYLAIWLAMPGGAERIRGYLSILRPDPGASG